MSWNNPLRHLAPLSDHPLASSSLSPVPTNSILDVTETSIRIDDDDRHNLRASRLLQAFFQNLDKDGQLALAADIQLLQHDDEQLVGLANHLLDSILKPFKLAGGQSPSPPQTEGSEDDLDHSMATMEISTRSEQKRMKSQCLRRDGFRCVFSGLWDLPSCEVEVVKPPLNEMRGYTECAHIIPFALGAFDEKNAVETRNEAIIWFSLHRYFPAISNKIDARSTNQRANAMTLRTDVYKLFGAYKLAFLPLGSNRYRATQFFEGAGIESKSGSPDILFISSDPSVPLPDEDFLKVHYIVAKILQESGFGAQISKEAEKAYLDLDCHMLDPSRFTDVSGKLSRLLLTSVRADGLK